MSSSALKQAVDELRQALHTVESALQSNPDATSAEIETLQSNPTTSAGGSGSHDGLVAHVLRELEHKARGQSGSAGQPAWGASASGGNAPQESAEPFGHHSSATAGSAGHPTPTEEEENTPSSGGSSGSSSHGEPGKKARHGGQTQSSSSFDEGA